MQIDFYVLRLNEERVRALLEKALGREVTRWFVVEDENALALYVKGEPYENKEHEPVREVGE